MSDSLFLQRLAASLMRMKWLLHMPSSVFILTSYDFLLCKWLQNDKLAIRHRLTAAGHKDISPKDAADFVMLDAIK